MQNQNSHKRRISHSLYNPVLEMNKNKISLVSGPIQVNQDKDPFVYFFEYKNWIFEPLHTKSKSTGQQVKSSRVQEFKSSRPIELRWKVKYCNPNHHNKKDVSKFDSDLACVPNQRSISLSFGLQYCSVPQDLKHSKMPLDPIILHSRCSQTNIPIHPALNLAL